MLRADRARSYLAPTVIARESCLH